MTTHRRYTFLDDRTDPPGHAKVLGILQHACERHWWFNEPEVQGKEFERLSFSFTVSARDQWFAHKRAMDLAERVYRGLGLGPSYVPIPLWEPLAPHDNRGRFRVPST
jgi:hypothetical protein